MLNSSSIVIFRYDIKNIYSFDREDEGLTSSLTSEKTFKQSYLEQNKNNGASAKRCKTCLNVIFFRKKIKNALFANLLCLSCLIDKILKVKDCVIYVFRVLFGIGTENFRLTYLKRVSFKNMC